MDKKTRIKISDMTDGATFTGRGVFVPEWACKKLQRATAKESTQIFAARQKLIIEADTENKNDTIHVKHNPGVYFYYINRSKILLITTVYATSILKQHLWICERRKYSD